MGMFIKLYSIALPIFLAIDILWLVLAKSFYTRHIGFLLTPHINWAAAFGFYVLFIAGLVVFVIHPAIVKNSLSQAVMLGGFFGLVTYATYDLTNLATVKNWPLAITLVDLAWGTFLGATVSAITFVITRKGI